MTQTCVAEPGTGSELESILATETTPIPAQSPTSVSLNPNRMLAFMNAMEYAEQANTVDELQDRYAVALAHATALEDITVKIFTTPEQAAQYEKEHPADNITRQEILGQTHRGSSPIIYPVAVIESEDPMAEQLFSPKNPLYARLTSGLASKLGDKLRYWTDGKSGLNTDAFIDECGIEKRITAGQANKKGYGILYMDLDRFKQYNDLDKSHEMGDSVIRMAGEAIRSNTRADDIAVREGSSADEFMLYVFGCNPEELIGVANRIRGALGEYEIPGHPNLKITASIGVSHSSEAKGAVGTSNKLRTLISLADRRMYQAKEQRDTVIPTTYNLPEKRYQAASQPSASPFPVVGAAERQVA